MEFGESSVKAGKSVIFPMFNRASFLRPEKRAGSWPARFLPDATLARLSGPFCPIPYAKFHTRAEREVHFLLRMHPVALAILAPLVGSVAGVCPGAVRGRISV